MVSSSPNPTETVLGDDERIALCARYHAVKAAIAAQSPDVALLCVSKTKPAAMIAALYTEGQRAFAENYLQEALSKIQALNALDLEWHFIGHVQRNKTKQLAAHFHWVQGVDRLIIAERLSDQRGEMLPPLNICLQVNIDDEMSKDGCTPEKAPSLVQAMSALPNVRLRGLMVIPRPNHAAAFSHAKQLFDALKAHHHKPDDWDTLSMGMSADMVDAIQAGATMVRAGTAVFGVR